MTYNDIEPQEVIKYFAEICKIPHGSGNEKELSDFLVKFAKDRNLWVHQDSLYNVIIKKPASKGYENLPPIILQGHMDMVCEKNKDKVHDFTKDAIELIIKDDFLKANGTTLGADNGIAVAMSLALLDSEKIPHPSLEVLVTTSEETGMFGANVVDPSLFDSKILINIDTETEGTFISCCAGGVRTNIFFPLQYANLSDEYIYCNISIKGLLGAHSGTGINKERGNAIKLLARALHSINLYHSIFIKEINGGSKENVIPRESEATIAVKKQDLDAVKNILCDLEKTYKEEYRVNESTVSIIFDTNSSIVEQVFTKELTEKIISAILLSPNGVQNMSLDIEGLVETSCNVGVIRTLEDKISIDSSIRSSVASKKYDLLEKFKMLAKLLDAEINVTGDYPAWEYNQNSHLRDIFIKTYEETYGEQPIITAVHAGLECGIFLKKFENIDMIAFGPSIYYAHTPEEKLSLSSLARTWEFFKAILLNICTNKY